MIVPTEIRREMLSETVLHDFQIIIIKSSYLIMVTALVSSQCMTISSINQSQVKK